MGIVCLEDDSYEMSRLIFSLKNNNINFRMSSAINLLSALKIETCQKRRPRSACVSVQSDQGLLCSSICLLCPKILRADSKGPDQTAGTHYPDVQ